ncbi:uncharacterized protein EAF01_010079 [Botrytis porri]|uniref:uncharacterized protein n=1 Tax=Botrytis porri TaxID=87229 RepID=UPI0018FFB1DC|nr:uncharacterized protein EAF01_010079 [Botrytis porri]KAF7894629.1 hypothetical protein EAF01_010079 [Botrytis porri]
MGTLSSKNAFPVHDKTILITGGSRGMGREVSHQLSQKGAHIIIVARDSQKLQEAISYIRLGALNPSTQRFHHISADLCSASECARVIDEVVAWNRGPPDTVWCCAGSAYPALFVDAPVEQIEKQMASNYMTSAYMAHATLRSWLKPLEDASTRDHDVSSSKSDTPPPARHLIFTASFVALYSFAGYAPYSPSKAALRSLSDSLSQEMNLYAAAFPDAPRVRVHTIFPATILTESYETENLTKHGLTLQLEEGDEGRTPHVIAERSIKGLEGGEELITTDMLTWLVKGGVLGGSVRGGFGRVILSWMLAGLMGIVMVFVRADMDRKARAWGRKFGVARSATK